MTDKPDRNGWSPIDSAPKDGTVILLAGDHGHNSNSYVVSGAWCEAGNGNGPFWTDFSVQSWGYEEYTELNPTHWQFLPVPPEAS